MGMVLWGREVSANLPQKKSNSGFCAADSTCGGEPIGESWCAFLTIASITKQEESRHVLMAVFSGAERAGVWQPF